MMRCNVDVQDLRRVLPPKMWLPESELEPEPLAADLDTHKHGPYPQRLSEWSLGPQPSWGWFQHLHASSEPGFPPGPDTDWPATLTTLSGLTASPEDASQDQASAPDSSDTTRQPDSTIHVHLAAETAATAMFVDSHDTGFYINSYTTKVNPGMDGVMDKLTAGLR